MKCPPLLIAAAVTLVAGRVSAASLQSRIDAVTVYPDRAVVTRSASISLEPGTAELVFADLPESLDERSIQVAGRGSASATILDVSAKRTFVDFTPNERVKAVEDQLRDLQRQQRSIDDQAAGFEAQRGMIDKIEAALVAPPAKDVPRPAVGDLASALAFVTEQRAKIAGGVAALDEQRTELQRRIAAAQAQLNELHGSGGRATKSVTVRVSASVAGSLDLTLGYTVPGATWSPTYDVRVLGGERAVQVGYFGLVRQATGEDWKDVDLTLSTARPSLGGRPPELAPWQLDVFVPPPPVPLSAFRDRRTEVNELKIAGPAAAGSTGINFAGEARADAPAMLAQATVQAGATSATFHVGARATIASDNSPQKVPIHSARLAAEPEYATTPKRLPVAFLTSKVANTSDFPLLAGAMSVFLEGTFVASSHMPTVMPGEKFDLALGADDGIGIKHKRLKKFTEETGLTNSGQRITCEYLLTVQNNKRTTERIVVTDQVPVSRNEKITVKLLSPDARDAKPDESGLLKWTLDLKPGEKRELTVRFTVEFDKDVNVSGLDLI